MSKESKAKHIFQISYDKSLLVTRAELLKSRRYEVISALGNEEAKRLLKKPDSYLLFIVGSGPSTDTRKEMVQWLKDNFPDTKILALNPSDEPILAGADFNFVLNGPEQWLAAVESLAA